MNRSSLLLFAFLAFGCTLYGQGVVISTNPTDVAPASAVFEVRGTDGGLLVPEMTTAQRLALTATAAEGLWVFQTDQHKGHYFFNGTNWVKSSNSLSVTGKVVTNSSEQMTGISGTGFTATQPSFPADKGEFNVLFTVPFGDVPTVILTSNVLPAIPINTTPEIYCNPTHSFNCSTSPGEDYIDDVIITSCEDDGLGGYNCNTDISDINSNCNNTPSNYVNNYPSMSTTMYGTNHGLGTSYFSMSMRSGPEWRDNLFGFIDWNQDADFDDTDEVVFEHYFASGAAYDALISDVIVIPAVAKSGATVLRTMTLFTIGTPNPCANLTWGETQDYRVDVVGGSVTLGDERTSHCTSSNVSTSGFTVYCTTLAEKRAGASFHFYAVEN